MGMWIYLMLLTIGLCINYTTSAIPLVCEGSVTTIDPNSTLPWSNYSFFCRILQPHIQQKFDLFHQHSKRPFTRRDCRISGCIGITAWNELVYGENATTAAIWGNSLQYLITVVQLKMCKVPMDHNVNRIVTFTTPQLNDYNNLCVGLYTTIDPIVRKSGHEQYSDSLPKAVPEDIFVHMTSDMLTQKEVERLNNGDHTIVVSTHRPECNKSTSDCHISIWYSTYIECHFQDYREFNQVERSTAYTNQDRQEAVARHLKLFKYDLFNRDIQEWDFPPNPTVIQVACDHFGIDNHPGSFAADTFRRLTVVTSYGPNITVLDVGGAKRIANHFYFQPDHQEIEFFVMIVSTLEEKYFYVTRLDEEPREGEILIQREFRNILNYTTIYTVTLSELTPLKTRVYKLSAGSSYNRKPVLDSVTIRISQLADIDVVINPVEISVVRGDSTSKPSFLCVAFGYPAPTLTWLAIWKLHDAKQVPVNASLLQKGYVGAYLQFPSASNLHYGYSGEYTCTASNPILGIKQATAILLVFQQGSTYAIFNKHVIEKEKLEGIEEDFGDLTDDEKSLLHRLDNSFVTEAHKTIKENKEVVAISLLAIVVGVSVIVSLVLWICIKIWRHRKQIKGFIVRKKKQKRVTASKKD